MASLSHFGLFVLLLHLASCTKAWDDILVIKTTSTSSDVLANITAQLAALEQIVAKHDCIVTQAVTKLEGLVSGTEAKLALIERKLQEERSNSMTKTILAKDIVTAINQGRFAIAEKKMLELNDTTTIADVLRDMFGNSDHDFGVLVNLAKGLNNSSLQSQILTTLFNKASESDNISTQNLVALAKCLSESGKGYRHEKVVGISSFKKLLDHITENAITTFVDVIKWEEDYLNNSLVRSLAADIAEWRGVSEKVMIGLVSGAFGTVDSKKILEAVCNHTDAWQALVGLGTLMVKLRDRDMLEYNVVQDIVSRFSVITTRLNLHPTVQNYVHKVKNMIPNWIVNLPSSKYVCIQNRDQSSFLVHSENYIDYKGAHMATKPPAQDGTAPKGAKWRLQRKEGKVFFESVTNPNSFVYASELVFREYRCAMAHSGKLDDKYAWVVEILEDGCYLKNVAKNQYMHSSDNIHPSTGYKLVGTMHKNHGKGECNSEENRGFVWQIVTEC